MQARTPSELLKHWVDKRGRTFSVRRRPKYSYGKSRFFAEIAESDERVISVSPNYASAGAATHWARRLQSQLADDDDNQKGGEHVPV